MAKVKVLVIEDDQSLQNLLKDTLALAGFDALVTTSAEEAESYLKSTSPDIIVSDINLPNMSGFEFLEKLRKTNKQIPFIALTARTDKMDVAVGFKTGADDYITKPFGVEELILRIHAVLRRSGLQGEETTKSIGNLTLDYDNVQVLCNNKDLELSPTEFKLFEVLLLNHPKVVRKSVLMREVWGYDFETSTAILDTYISYLRKKIPSESRVLIKTVRGVGFKLEEST
ncbi:MAG: hypothetical protein RIS09_1164 [Actinomycetota bacterium]|jgi:two-component system OmpR family response regulator